MELDSFFEKAKEWDTPPRIEMANAFISEIRKNIKINADYDLLEFGCGTGLVGLSFVNSVHSIKMIDTSQAMLGVLKEKIRLKDISNVDIFHGNIRDYNSHPVDLIFSLMAFHHVDDIKSTVEMFYKLLKNRGYVIIGDLLKEDGSFHGDEKVAHNGFDLNEIKKMFSECNFCVEKEYKYNVIKKTIQNGVVKEFEQFILFAQKL